MSAETVVYLDSSALARVEVVRAVRPHGARAISRARQMLARISLLRLDDSLLDAAGVLEGDALRSLDAIHLAAAQTIGGDLAEIVTYDHRMAGAAANAGLTVAAPA